MAVKITTENFNETVLESKAPVLVDFWAEWCGPCRMIGPTIEELSTEYEGTAVIGKVNVDEQPQLASQFSVMSIPTLLLFKDGKVVNKMVGAKGKDALKELIDQAL